MLVVVLIIAILVGIAVPAIFAARDSARSAGCQNNLRQLAIGLNQYALRKTLYCSGAFNWMYDGAVNEVGWVADLVNQGTQVGLLLCPSNPLKFADTYQDLLSATPGTLTTCNVVPAGNPPSLLPSGATDPNSSPCYQIINAIATYAPQSAVRQQLVTNAILAASYNTNYTASWFLVRTGVKLDASGNFVQPTQSGCSWSLTNALLDRNSTIGPLNPAWFQGANLPANAIPLMGCGAASPGKSLPVAMGTTDVGAGLTASMTGGPVMASNMKPPTFAPGTPYSGSTGWWATWSNPTIVMQDYRQYAPVHRSYTNIAFADGSVRTFWDVNNDGQLNNSADGTHAFPAATPSNPNGFTDGTVETVPADLFSTWSLQGP